jgi:hypothetical protein
MYKCLKSDFAKLERKINRIIKKASKYNIHYEFEIIGETVENVQVIDYSDPTNPIIKDSVPAEVIEYKFQMNDIKLGNYEVVAILEHGIAENSYANLIHLINENIEIDKKYKTIKGYCEHCNTNRRRKKTALLKENDKMIQVGLTCLKDYTGIQDIDIIKDYMNVKDIIIEDISINYNKIHSYPVFEETVIYLAHSIEIIQKSGYKKGVTKDTAWNKIEDKIDEEYIMKAKEIIEYFSQREFNDIFLSNIKGALSNKYCKNSGLIAYAYLAYKKHLEWEEKEKALQREKELSNYIGEIGERLAQKVTLTNIFSFETMFGYQRLYIMKDKRDNVFTWKTSVLMAYENDYIEIDDWFVIQGTVKGHKNYNGTKQTELTRCKVLERFEEEINNELYE